MRVVTQQRVGWVGVAVVLLLASLTIAFAPSRAEVWADEGPQGIDARISGSAQGELLRDLLRLTNEDRAERGRAELTLARAISRYATQHSRQMANAGRLFHSSENDLRTALAGVEWSHAGENVGVGSALKDVQAAFMASRTHRANVLKRPYEHAALGIVVDDDRVWVTVVFYGD